MNKSFYKSRRAIPTFYNKDLKTRFSAYGEEVSNNFLSWRKKFCSMWRDERTNVLLSAQGCIDGIEARLSGDEYVVTKGDANVVRSTSALPPLIFYDDVWEVNGNGFVFCNGEKTTLNIGSELKAWALLTTFNSMREAYLVVIGKPSSNSSQAKLSVYTMPFEDNEAVLLDSVDMVTTLDASSFLICFERHIFSVHASKLYYYYFNAQDCKLECCSIGADGDNPKFKWCQYVKPRVVCDNCGNVYWATDKTLYCVPLGYPRNLLIVDDFEGRECCNLQCFDNALYAYYERYGEVVCFKYVLDDGMFVKRKFNVGAKANLFVSVTDVSSTYVKIVEGDNFDKATMTTKGDDGKEIARGQALAVTKNAFCFFGEIVDNSRYVGINMRKNKISYTKN